MNTPGTLITAKPFDTEFHQDHAIESAFLEFDDALGRRVSLYAARCFPIGGDAEAKLPTVLHLPGGGQTVYPDDLLWWARRGFAACSYDWQLTASPRPGRKTIFPAGVVSQHESFNTIEQAVLPIAIKASGVVIDWMCDHPRVDPARVGVTGISWGGFLTWAVNSYEKRVKAAVPVYGCGGLFRGDHGYHVGSFGGPMAETYRTQWDAAALGDRQISPVCFISSTNDFFGYHTHADELLNKLTVPHRRSSEANDDHHVGPRGAATAVAWLKHYLVDGPALPPEPALRADWTIDLRGAKEPVVETEIWWTPSARMEDCRCWWRGKPARPGDARLAFGRVRFASGVTLNTPTRVFANADPQPLASDTWPDARSGIALYNLGSTQFHFPPVTIEPVLGDPTSAAYSIDRPGGGVIGFAFRGLGDPRWVASPFDALEITIDWLGGAMTELFCVADFATADNRRANVLIPAPATHAAGKSVITLRLADFPKRPEGATWGDLHRLNIQGKATVSRFVVGPIRKKA